MHAAPFPEPWGFSQLVNENTTNIWNATTQAWTKSATDYSPITGKIINNSDPGLAGMIIFGFFPLILSTLVLIRFKNMVVTLFVLVLSTQLLNYFKLIPGLMLWIYNVISIIIVAIAIYDFFFGKSGGY